MASDEQPELTILMPCLNEVETLEFCIAAARKGIAKAGISAEILIADNGSTDGSPELATSLGARVVSVPKKGYGNALRGGFKAAKGKYIIMGDADGSYDFSQIEPFINHLRAGADLVMGCRLPSGGGKIEPGAMPWKHRWIGNPALTFIGRLLFNCPSHDFHCGLRALTKKAFEKMGLQTEGMELASEMVIKASLQNLQIAEVPITLHKDRRSRPPHLRSWRDGWRHLRFMLLFSPRWLFLYPGLLAFVIGALLFLRLLSGPITVANIEFDLNSLEIAGMAVLFGWQLILFACFARIFAHTRKLLPPNKTLLKAFDLFTLEKGLLAGGFLLLAGIAVILWTTAGWIATSFGELDPRHSTRFVILGRTLASLGLQTIVFSLIFSYLGVDDPSDPQKPTNH